jgi:cell division septal protein FtsQ
MKGRSALPRVAFLLGLLVVVGGVAGAVWGRTLLTHVNYFNVKQVEVAGAHWAAPDSLLHLAAIRSDRSVWDDFDDVESRLEEHPLIESAVIKRSGLRGLRLIVSEVEPIALVSVPNLGAVRADGTLLPIDPTRTPLDLPLVAVDAQVNEDSTRLAEGPALDALLIFAKLQTLDPALAALASDFELAADRGLIVNMVESQPVQSLVLPAEFGEVLVKRVRATLSDLRSRGIEATVMEARYANQIVVRRQQA